MNNVQYAIAEFVDIGAPPWLDRPLRVPYNHYTMDSLSKNDVVEITSEKGHWTKEFTVSVVAQYKNEQEEWIKTIYIH